MNYPFNPLAGRQRRKYKDIWLLSVQPADGSHKITQPFIFFCCKDRKPRPHTSIPSRGFKVSPRPNGTYGPSMSSKLLGLLSVGQNLQRDMIYPNHLR